MKLMWSGLYDKHDEAQCFFFFFFLIVTKKFLNSMDALVEV